MTGFEAGLYYGSTGIAPQRKKHWDELYPSLGRGGKFWLDIQECFGINWLVARAGDWPTPWRALLPPGFEMPRAVPNFSLTFAEITDRLARETFSRAEKTNKPVTLFYSGGIDSTIVLVALLRNFPAAAHNLIHVCMSADSIVENPTFYEKFVRGRLTVLDSSRHQYGDVERAGGVSITADQGDSLFGTEMALQFYHRYHSLLSTASQPARKRIEAVARNGGMDALAAAPFPLFAELIQKHLAVPRNPDFGRIFYALVVANIESCRAPVHTVHDFFWWVIFNLKYMDSALRSVLFYNSGGGTRSALEGSIMNWFHDPDYQRWSLANNNNGEKIHGWRPTTYKWAGRKYIHDFDGNTWYFRNKLKLLSLENLFLRSKTFIDHSATFGIDSNYEPISFAKPGTLRAIESGLQNFSLPEGI